jgi:UDP-N-acetylmuramoylalanine--D-glutamate ligase
MAGMMGVPVIGDVELLARAIGALPERGRPRVVAITGTNGKSTTTALIGHILKEAGLDVRVGGNIGTGVLDLAPLRSHAVYVLELSSYQLDLVKSLRCNVAVWLNLTPDHLDRHGDMAGYRAAKFRIFQNMTPADTAVIGVDSLDMEAVSLEVSQLSPAPRITEISARFALPAGVSVVGATLHDGTEPYGRRVGSVDGLDRLPGQHNHQNIAAAFAACRALGLAAETIMDALRTFGGLAHRLETVAQIEGVRFVNDSKATNADSTQQALKAYPRVYWIAGGKAKSDGIDPLAPLFPRVVKAYLIGEAQERFAATLQGHVPVQRCGVMESAVRAAFRDARESGETAPVVLLSPACASFDQFRDFEHRGEEFRRAVLALGGAPVSAAPMLPEERTAAR